MGLIWSSDKTDQHVLFTAIYSVIWKIGKAHSFRITIVRMHLGIFISDTIVHLNKTQKSFLWITSAYLGFCLLHHLFQIFILWRVMLKNNSVYFLAIYVNFPWKIEKFWISSCRCGFYRDRILLSGQQLT